jgi:hypothetical protein
LRGEAKGKLAYGQKQRSITAVCHILLTCPKNEEQIPEMRTVNKKAPAESTIFALH